MSDPFAPIAKAYANIISEAKGRLMIAEQVLAKPDPEDVLEYVGASDLCALQFRKAFEAIALGCLAMHGDLPGTKRLKDDVYRADKLIKALTKLHSDFYPVPCRIVERTPNSPRGKISEIKDGWLTKEELLRLYFECDHQMHVGTITRRATNAVAIDLESFRTILGEASLLIAVHWITRVDHSRVLCDTTSDDGPMLMDVYTPI
jgi:hypothetical protein